MKLASTINAITLTSGSNTFAQSGKEYAQNFLESLREAGYDV
jgi:hypothetical protein